MNGSADISSDGLYRYKLLRGWGIGPRVLWIMLNPSTADGMQDDNTIRKCIAFSKREGFGSMTVGNIYAYRSTDPSALGGLPAPIAYGPSNRQALWELSLEAQMIICAWGVRAPPRGLDPYDISHTPRGFWCLGRTKHGSPKHPLYLAKNTPLERFST